MLFVAGVADRTRFTKAAIKSILDNHSAHLAEETNAWIESQPAGRFSFVFTPKNGFLLSTFSSASSPKWFASCTAIRVAFEAELKARIRAYLNDIN